jgi:hypothetical protein
VPSSYPAKKPIPTDSKSFEMFAAVVWGSVMWLFENRRVNLNNGLVNSMDCEYRGGTAEVGIASLEESLTSRQVLLFPLSQIYTSMQSIGTVFAIWSGTTPKSSSLSHMHLPLSRLPARNEIPSSSHCRSMGRLVKRTRAADTS